MSDKIDIRMVRTIAEAVKRVYHDDDILALVKAVEAAHAFMVNEGMGTARYHAALEEALERFDFGDDERGENASKKS